ncbi:hypothetical protein [Shimia thalassica]|uniref:hypothetical protein n=1 Tax=Shimia thalassica TaxID=1715693 RepID=UPI0026E2E71C|nr:hypothetical protein [Shimia thalassica]MDO6483202.1 hypothetical protein [Shimia thalassica]
MKTVLRTALIAALISPIVISTADAGRISNACMQSDRKAKSRNLCRCIQNVADQNLTRRDQKMAASFFSDPHKAQEIRQSDNRSHEDFWKRYSEFGGVVAASCSHLKK